MHRWPTACHIVCSLAFVSGPVGFVSCLATCSLCWLVCVCVCVYTVCVCALLLISATHLPMTFSLFCANYKTNCELARGAHAQHVRTWIRPTSHRLMEDAKGGTSGRGEGGGGQAHLRFRHYTKPAANAKVPPVVALEEELP